MSATTDLLASMIAGMFLRSYRGNMKTRINVEEIASLKNRIKEINSIPLEEIEFLRDGEPLTISSECLDSWKYVGLNNIDFIDCDYISVFATHQDKSIDDNLD